MSKYYMPEINWKLRSWTVRYGTEDKYDIAAWFKAHPDQSTQRTRDEMQELLDHINKQLKNK